MSTIAKLTKLLPSALAFHSHAVPTIQIAGTITHETYGLAYAARSTSTPCSRRYPAIRIKLRC